MESSHVHRRRLAFLAEATVALGIATGTAVSLSAYGVPLVLVACCWCAVSCSLLELFDRLVQAATITTYRCPKAGCDFKVAVRHVSAAENRRWQEIAAAHPHRYQP